MDKATTQSRLGPIELEVIHGTIRAAELEIECVAKDDVCRGDPNVAWRGKLGLDVLGVLPRGLTRGDAAVERVVSPVEGRQLLQVARRQLVGDHRRRELGRAEDVIPVGVAEDDVGWARHSLIRQERQKLARVHRRGAGVEPDRRPLADHCGERRAVRRCRRHPVDVLRDPNG